MARLSLAGSGTRQTGPGAAYSPSSSMLKKRSGATASEPKYLIGVVIGEIVLLGCLRRMFKRYHGG